MMDRLHEEKTIKSAWESSTFDANLSIHVQKDATDIGSATISPSGRDVAIASYVFNYLATCSCFLVVTVFTKPLAKQLSPAKPASI